MKSTSDSKAQIITVTKAYVNLLLLLQSQVKKSCTSSPTHLWVVSFNGEKIRERPPSQEPHDGGAHLWAQQVTKFHLQGSLLHLTQTEYW